MTPFESVRVEVRSGRLADLDADLLVVPTFTDDVLDDIASLGEEAGRQWKHAHESGEITGKPWDMTVLPSGAPTGNPGAVSDRRLLMVGVGPRAACSPEAIRRFAAVGVLQARPRRARRVAIVIRTPAGSSGDTEQLVQAASEGATLAQLDTSGYKTGPRDSATLESIAIVLDATSGSTDGSLVEAARRGVILGEAANDARRLGNEPSNLLTPSIFAERATDLAAGTGLRVDILDEHRMRTFGMGLLLGVASGSAEPPRLITLTHAPDGVAGGPVLGLVGKGITFDTGGISIKPADGMERMKVDMGGGAAVITAMRALARLHVPLRVVGIVPSSENMPGGRALKPGDVLTGAGGKTVEVVNTDAEGRLVLADGLWYAQQVGATHLVDVATLTGACVVALGRTTAGLFGTPEPWVQALRAAADRAGERAWPMPLFEDYFEQLKSDVADMANVGGRPAGSVTAAMFLKQFVDDRPWAHLDIAGTVWNDDAKPWMPKGATGAATRTLAELALAHGAWAA